MSGSAESAHRTAPRRFTFPRRLRVLHNVDFARILAIGLRAADGRITLTAAANGLAYARLGLIVGRKLGCAVRRNRLKRIIRTAFRLSQHEFPRGLDLLVAPRAEAELDVEGVRASLTRLAAQLAHRGALRPQPGAGRRGERQR